MRIGLLNCEPKYTNIALEKLRLYHQEQGDEVYDYLPIMDYDRVYASSIFDFTGKSQIPADAICGGTGFDLTIMLPPEIDRMKPKINIGFTSRGCIRHCPFCVVPQKEGAIRATGDIYDIWDGKSRDLTLLDNNILAIPAHFFMIADQLITEKIRVDFNQGLDIRLLTPEIASKLAQLRHKEYHFAFDVMADWKKVKIGIRILQDHGINRSTFLCLAGFKPHDALMNRLMLLRRYGQNACVMRYKRDRELMQIARWANQHHIFQAMTYDQFKAREYPQSKEPI